MPPAIDLSFPCPLLLPSGTHLRLTQSVCASGSASKSSCKAPTPVAALFLPALPVPCHPPPPRPVRDAVLSCPAACARPAEEQAEARRGGGGQHRDHRRPRRARARQGERREPHGACARHVVRGPACRSTGGLRRSRSSTRAPRSARSSCMTAPTTSSRSREAGQAVRPCRALFWRYLIHY